MKLIRSWFVGVGLPGVPRLWAVVWWVCLFAQCGCAAGPAPGGGDAESAPGQSALTIANPAAAPPLPHLRVDRENGWVDLDATVNLREGEWIELFACAPDSRTHESILVVWAEPSHVHLALLTLGLTPGKPMQWIAEDGGVRTVPPRGPEVAVSVVVQVPGGLVEVPANQWVVNKRTGQVLEGNHWLFTGSTIVELNDRPDQRYRADVDGSVISLVNFGDDVLARATDRTRDNDQGMWVPLTEQIPPVGTAVTIRLRPVKDEPDQPGG